MLRRWPRLHVANAITLLAFCLIQFARDFDPAQPIYIFGDAAIERLGYALTVFAGGKAVLVGGIAHERNFGEDGRHIGADEDDEGGFLHPTIANSWTLGRKATVQRLLHIPGKFAGFF